MRKKFTEHYNDEDIGIFNSLLPHLRQLTPRDKLSLRMQVQNIRFNMSYSPDPHPSTFTFQSSRSTSNASYVSSSDNNFGYREANEDSNLPHYALSTSTATHTTPATHTTTGTYTATVTYLCHPTRRTYTVLTLT